MAVDVETVGTTEDTTPLDTPTWHVELPDFDDGEAVDQFRQQLDQHSHIRGVKTLWQYMDKYLDSTRLARQHLKQVHISMNTINGVRTAQARIPDELRKFKAACKRYFNALNTPELRHECTMLGVDYDGYDTMDDVVTALVDARVAMRGE